MAELPEMIGKYKIDSLVAKGGMGAVYKAIHPTLRRYVILKKLTIRGNAAITERFKREARILLDFKHANIVHFFDYFKEGNSHYIVLEYVDGMSLDKLIQKRRYLSGPLALLIFLDACKALKYAHDSGVIHRDIKPANILISKKGAVKLADFGIAASENELDDGLTKEGMTLGTPSYMPPEQFENTKNVDKRADIYAMGIMLYEIVSGRKPYPGNLAPDTILMIQKGRHVPIRKINPDVPPLVSDLIRKMIRPNPRKRYQDLAPVIRKVERYLARFNVADIQKALTDSINTDLKEEPVFKMRRKKRMVIIPAAVLAIALAGGILAAERSGYLYKWLLPSRYAPLQVSFRIPKSHIDSRDVLLLARLYRNDREDIPEVENAELEFRLQPGADTETYHTFITKQLVLPPGSYRLKLFTGQRLYWESFELFSFTQLAASGNSGNLVDLLYDRIETQPLAVRLNASDAVSGKTPAVPVRLLVQLDGRWQEAATVDSSKLRTGRVQRFRAEAEGYYPELFSLLIGSWQKELVLKANLMPLPGTLQILEAPHDVRLQINGSSTVMGAGEHIQWFSTKEYRGGEASWDLPSGTWSLSASYRSSTSERSITVKPGNFVRIRIETKDGGLYIKEE